MYYEVKMRQMLLLRPSELGEGVFFQKAFLERLLQNVSRVPCTEEHGYIVTVTRIQDVSDGKVRADTGSVAYSVIFNAIVCNLHEQEVVEVEVETVSKLGCITNAGPCSIFLPADHIKDFEFKTGADDTYNCYKGIDGAEIRKGSIVRVAIYCKQWRAEDRSYRYIGSLKRNYCGLSPAFADVNEVLRQGDSTNWDIPMSPVPATLGKDGKTGGKDGKTGGKDGESGDTGIEDEEDEEAGAEETGREEHTTKADADMEDVDSDEVVEDVGDKD